MQQHKPVLLSEVIEAATECERDVKHILDGTFGRGGHTKALLEKFPNAHVTGLDRDADAIKYGEVNFEQEIESGRLRLRHSNFADIEDLKLEGFDFAILDLGVSSPQLDVAERGFSFYKDGPLDMRMDRREPVSAHEIVNFWDEEDLNELFRKYGEVRSPQRVVQAIVKDRQKKHFESTLELGNMIARVAGWKKKGHHPATQYFLALRIKVNHEFDDIERGVRAVTSLINPGGRIAVITFHSSEDRIVKYAFRSLAETEGDIVNKKVIVPSRAEEKENPRSRSAKLRVFQRGPRERVANE
jgi:16S rRNA (cytosine1402-N4)-methyltransferase